MRKTLVLLAFAAAVLTFAGVAQAVPHCSSASISGPSDVYAETMCVNPTWSINCGCSFGYTPFFIWKVDGTSTGGGSSTSATFCPTTPAQTDTIEVWVGIACGRAFYSHSKSVFVSQCDDTTSPPTCLG